MIFPHMLTYFKICILHIVLQFFKSIFYCVSVFVLRNGRAAISANGGSCKTLTLSGFDKGSGEFQSQGSNVFWDGNHEYYVSFCDSNGKVFLNEGSSNNNSITKIDRTCTKYTALRENFQSDSWQTGTGTNEPNARLECSRLQYPCSMEPGSLEAPAGAHTVQINGSNSYHVQIFQNQFYKDRSSKITHKLL